MSKKVYLFSLVLLSLIFASCSETEEVGKYDNWRTRNEAFIDSLATVYETASDKGGLSRIELLSAPNEYIYYKVKTAVAPARETTSPLYTDWVKVYYKGTNILREMFDGNFSGSDPVIGGTNPGQGDSPATKFQVNKVITGWTEALQKMKINDRWEIFIPWKYAYGSSGNDAILGYSALIFDVTLVDFANSEEELND